MPFVYTEDRTVTVGSEALADEARTQNIDTRTISLDYFRAMGIDLRAGELFSAQDRASAPGVVIINQTMARRFWPDEDPIGKRIKLGRAASDSPWLTVKGVVADSAQSSLDAVINPEAYFPLAQTAGMYRRINLVMRTASDPKGIVSAVKREIQSLDPNQPMYQVQTMEELISESVGARRFALRMLELFGALALLLAAVGIYGVLSYITTARTHEIGLRIALGARTGDVLRLVIGQGMKLALIGAGAGLLAAFALTRLMSNLLYGVSATDPVTFAGVALLLLAVALLACYLPARRAARTDPMIALRCE
jgi:putative ABC transport system permease protein